MRFEGKSVTMALSMGMRRISVLLALTLISFANSEGNVTESDREKRKCNNYQPDSTPN